MATTVFHIQGMTCGHCAMHVTKALKSVPGVSDAVVDLAKAEATVTHEGPLERDAVQTVVEDAGYQLAKDGR
jgi:copper chaperone CopZ